MVADLTNIDKTELVPNVFRLHFPSRYLLTSTFLRFQEHYESPEFKDKVFSLEEYMDWYAEQKGNFTYYQDWSGFNIPSYVLDKFYEGDFNPLSKKEEWFLSQFKNEGKFYVIGTFENPENAGHLEDVLKHEVAHGLFYTNDKYREQVVDAMGNADFSQVESWLGSSAGYHESVWQDECHAYCISGLENLQEDHSIDITNLLDTKKKLERIFRKFTKGTNLKKSLQS